MEFGMQLLMGVSLAACAGLRAWMPLLMLGLAARMGWVPLHPSFALLTHVGTLTVLGVATIAEILGDKIIAVDHMLDVLGSALRPAAGTVLAASLLTNISPEISLVLGLIAGGGTALTVHAGKSAARAATTVLAPAHLGTGNAFVSLVEDVLAFGGIFAALIVPVVAFVFVLVAIWAVRRIILRVRKRSGYAGAAPPA